MKGNQKQTESKVDSGAISNPVDQQSFTKFSNLINEAKYVKTNNIQQSIIIENESSTIQINLLHFILSNIKKLHRRIECGNY